MPVYHDLVAAVAAAIIIIIDFVRQITIDAVLFNGKRKK